MDRTVKIMGFCTLFLIMLGTTMWASLQQNLFTGFSWTGSPMWFKATLVDFYINQIILWFWVVYLEPKNLVRGLWLILFVCFGSMGTTGFIVYKLVRKQSLFKREES